MWVVSFYFLYTNNAELNTRIHVKFVEISDNFFGADFFAVGTQGEKSMFVLNLWTLFCPSVPETAGTIGKREYLCHHTFPGFMCYYF